MSGGPSSVTAWNSEHVVGQRIPPSVGVRVLVAVILTGTLSVLDSTLVVPLLTTIGDDLAAGRTEAADDAVHMVGHVLEDLQVLLPKAELPEEAVAAVKRGVNDLFDCFDDLDTALHAPPGKSAPPAEVHAGLAERIQAALGGIEGAVKPRTGEK